MVGMPSLPHSSMHFSRVGILLLALGGIGIDVVAVHGQRRDVDAGLAGFCP